MTAEKTAEFEILAARHRHVWTEDKRTYAKRYSRGDIATLPDNDHSAYLVTLGGLRRVEAGTEPVTETTPEVTEDVPETPAAKSGQTVPETSPDGTEEPPGVLGADAEIEDGSDKPDSAHDDGYDDLAYAEVVKTAKARDLNAGGTKDEIVARLREHDASA